MISDIVDICFCGIKTESIHIVNCSVSLSLTSIYFQDEEEYYTDGPGQQPVHVYPSCITANISNQSTVRIFLHNLKWWYWQYLYFCLCESHFATHWGGAKDMTLFVNVPFVVLTCGICLTVWSVRDNERSDQITYHSTPFKLMQHHTWFCSSMSFSQNCLCWLFFVSSVHLNTSNSEQKSSYGILQLLFNPVYYSPPDISCVLMLDISVHCQWNTFFFFCF